MINHKQYMQVTTVIFAIVAVVHALRVYNGWNVMVGPYALPIWCSVAGVIVAGVLAWSGYKMMK